MKEMKRLTVIRGIILVLIVALLTTLGIIFNKKNKVYTDMENNLVNATKKYVEKSFAYPKDGKELRVSFEELKDSGLINDLKVNNDKCDGYAIVKKNQLVYEYKGFVKCKEYKTKNYSE